MGGSKRHAFLAACNTEPERPKKAREDYDNPLSSGIGAHADHDHCRVEARSKRPRVKTNLGNHLEVSKRLTQPTAMRKTGLDPYHQPSINAEVLSSTKPEPKLGRETKKKDEVLHTQILTRNAESSKLYHRNLTVMERNIVSASSHANRTAAGSQSTGSRGKFLEVRELSSDCEISNSGKENHSFDPIQSAFSAVTEGQDGQIHSSTVHSSKSRTNSPLHGAKSPLHADTEPTNVNNAAILDELSAINHSQINSISKEIGDCILTESSKNRPIHNKAEFREFTDINHKSYPLEHADELRRGKCTVSLVTTPDYVSESLKEMIPRSSTPMYLQNDNEKWSFSKHDNHDEGEAHVMCKSLEISGLQNDAADDAKCFISHNPERHFERQNAKHNIRAKGVLPNSETDHLPARSSLNEFDGSAKSFAVVGVEKYATDCLVLTSNRKGSKLQSLPSFSVNGDFGEESQELSWLEDDEIAESKFSDENMFAEHRDQLAELEAIALASRGDDAMVIPEDDPGFPQTQLPTDGFDEITHPQNESQILCPYDHNTAMKNASRESKDVTSFQSAGDISQTCSFQQRDSCLSSQTKTFRELTSGRFSFRFPQMNLHKPSPTVNQLRMMIFLESTKGNRGRGSIGAFADYWESLESFVTFSSHGSELNCPPNRLRVKLKEFLTSRKLKRLHNKLVLAIMSEALKTHVSSERNYRHIPHMWKSNAEIRNTPLADAEKDDLRSCSDDLTTYSRQWRDMLRKDSGVWSVHWRESIHKESNFHTFHDVQKSNLDHEEVISTARLPALLQINPRVQQLVSNAGKTVSEKAICMLIASVREFVSALIKKTIWNANDQRTGCEDNPEHNFTSTSHENNEFQTTSVDRYDSSHVDHDLKQKNTTILHAADLARAIGSNADFALRERAGLHDSFCSCLNGVNSLINAAIDRAAREDSDHAENA